MALVFICYPLDVGILARWGNSPNSFLGGLIIFSCLFTTHKEDAFFQMNYAIIGIGAIMMIA